METEECWACEKEFEWSWENTHVSCDTIEGQYTEFTAITCPHCGCETRW